MAFTRDWDKTAPDGDTTTVAEIDDVIQNLRDDLEDRMSDMFYGFNTSDATGAEAEYGIKHLKLGVQATEPSYAAGYGFLFTKSISGNPELYYRDDAAEIKLTTAGSINVAGNIPADSIDQDDIQLADEGWLSSASNASLIRGVGSVTVIGNGNSAATRAQLSSADVGTADACIATKKYVNDQDTATTAANAIQDGGDAVAFQATLTAADTYQNLDLSAEIESFAGLGANFAIVCLEISASAAINFQIQPAGFSSSDTDHTLWTGMDTVRLSSATDVAYITTTTNASGVLQMKGNSTSPTVTVKVIAYKV